MTWRIGKRIRCKSTGYIGVIIDIRDGVAWVCFGGQMDIDIKVGHHNYELV